MRIIGIDPGISTTGYGIVEVKNNAIQCITYGGVSARNGSDFSQKLLGIFDRICEVIDEFAPEFCAVEDIFYHQNKKTAIVMGHARAAGILAAARKGLPVFEYTPREVKMSIVGFGAASKEQIQAMVKNLLHLEEIPHPNDAADALAVAMCHYHRSRFREISKR